MAQRLTDKLARALDTPARGNRITYDAGVAGFGLRITAAGSKAFVLNYRRRGDGLERRYTIGSWPDWSVVAAREEARRLKRDIDSGGDPVGKVRADREAPTVADLCARFDEEHISRKRSSTQLEYRAMIRNQILPALGAMRADAVAFEDIDRLHRKISKGTPYRANRTVAVLSRMFSHAIRQRLRPDNPCRGIERNQEAKRKRYLKPDELGRLMKALASSPDQQAANVFRLLLLTGARRGEALSATWDQFDLAAGTWTKPGATTKQRTDHVVPLSGPARRLLADIRRTTNSDYVFPSPRGSGHRKEIKPSWTHVCKAASVTGLRIHDLRHSFASTLAGANYSLPTIGALLGHTQAQTTARYAHLLDDPLREATERAGAILSGETPARGRR